jgi:hypothetical protein
VGGVVQSVAIASRTAHPESIKRVQDRVEIADQMKTFKMEQCGYLKTCAAELRTRRDISEFRIPGEGHFRREFSLLLRCAGEGGVETRSDWNVVSMLRMLSGMNGMSVRWRYMRT